ncbi:MAG: hypothetical protein AAF552_03950 [Pseudomonadota bacterium]
MKPRITSILLLLLTLSWTPQGAARWTWDSSAVDERQQLDLHLEALVTAHENFKRLAAGEAPPPFDPTQLANTVAALNDLLSNSIDPGNEQHYRATVDRIRSYLDDRIDRIEYEVNRLQLSRDAADQARLERLITQDYFALPKLLAVKERSRYEQLEGMARAKLGL